MSLISEALKKARQEAARQDAQRPRSPYAVGAADSAERRNGLVPVLAGVGAGCLLAGLILAVAWSAGWGPFARPAQPAAQVSQAAPASPPPAPVETAVEPSAPPPALVPQESAPAPVERPAAAPPPAQESRPQPILEVRPTAPAEAPGARPAPTPPAAPAEEEQTPAATVPAAPAPAAPLRPSSPTPPLSAGDLVDGRTYVGEVPLPGGGALKLNGIAFSQDRPVAVLDGRVMGPGELIQGFTITAIEAGRVKLQGYGATVFVSPK